MAQPSRGDRRGDAGRAAHPRLHALAERIPSAQICENGLMRRRDRPWWCSSRHRLDRRPEPPGPRPLVQMPLASRQRREPLRATITAAQVQPVSCSQAGDCRSRIQPRRPQK